MHEALHLPEIVSNIVRFNDWHSSPKFLYTCLFINKNFSLEAARILWRMCGGGYQSWSSPEIKDLVRIAQIDAERAQFYANFIRALTFFADRGSVVDDGAAFTHDFRNDEARWHGDLAFLKFPHLHHVEFNLTGNADVLNTGDAVIHYAQPNVECFKLDKGSKISDSFLDSLCHSCPKLKEVTLRTISESTVSKVGLIRFFKNLDQADHIDLRDSFQTSWSHEAFNVLGKIPNLSTLCLPEILGNWIDHLDNDAFPNLYHLETSISDNNLSYLAQATPELRFLYLYLERISPSYHILRSASNFTNLTMLDIEFGLGCSVSGQDLVLLARNCRELSRISLGELFRNRPSGVDITDSTIAEMAGFMPQIENLSLMFDKADFLSWESIFCLGQNCKNLTMLTLSCNIVWKDAILSMEKDMFPQLWHLGIVLEANNRPGQVLDDVNNIKTLVSQLADSAPKLMSFTLENGNEADDLVQQTFESEFEMIRSAS
jgi:hypothetical protein